MWSSARSARQSTLVSPRSAANAVVERLDCDLDFADPASLWIDQALEKLVPPDAVRGRVIEVDFGAKSATSLDIVEAEITEHINLNSSRSEKETIHLALAFDGAAPAYQPATRSISIRRTIRARSASCSSRPVLPPTTRCVRADQVARHQPRCPSRRWTPMLRGRATSTSRRSSPAARRALDRRRN